MEKFKILTLNCWAVMPPMATVRKDDRVNYLIKRLLDGVFDIVMLQEIWLDEDYKKLKDSLKSVYPYCIRFQSHFHGSGLCILTKWTVDNVFFHQYTINGYPHLVTEPDWYCGKGVGVVRVTSKNGFRINLYDTHLIARYALDRDKDRFDAHRLVQITELIQLIRFSSSSADAIIVTGDFNLSSSTPAINLFRSFLGVSDAWLNNEAAAGKPVEALEFEGCTCDRPDNPYRNDAWAKYYGNGERLDYIFYRSGTGPVDPELSPNLVQFRCHSCWLEMREVAEDVSGLHYSDHEGVAAEFTLTRLNPSKAIEKPKLSSAEAVEQLITKLISRVDRGISIGNKRRRTHFSVGLFTMLGLIMIFSCAPGFGAFGIRFALCISAVAGALCFMLFWGVAVGHRCNRKALECGRVALDIMLQQNHRKPRPKESGDEVETSRRMGLKDSGEVME
ncbi:unnamed protein product [Calicophoron daubneyi]|uniref:sphingomyelin phosphodiesterase n=1 Tax=Calicophoron daubneyi TaxID=300641 RepID=A0AAV2TIJ2_CALDB